MSGRDVVKRIAEGYLERTNRLRMMPSFLIVGTQRGGTTSLYRYLVQHPSVAPTLVSKGVHFFDTNYRRGGGWYRGHFPLLAYRRFREAVRKTPLITGEGSPYYLFHPHAASRIASLLPDVKLIAMLRDPVSRAYSHHQHETEGGFEDLSFEDAIKAEPERLQGEEERMLQDPTYNSFHHQHHSYLMRGRYAEQIKRCMAFFPRDQMLILRSEDFFADPAAAFESVLGFLELSPRPLPLYRQFNAHTYPAMRAETRAQLREHFAEPNAELSSLLGGSPWWAPPEAKDRAAGRL